MTNEEAIKNIYNQYIKEKAIPTSATSVLDFKQFTSSDFIFNDMPEHLQIVIIYMKYLSNVVFEEHCNEVDLNKELVDELIFANQDGVACQYISLVGYFMAKYLFEIDDIEFVQGMYNSDSNNGFGLLKQFFDNMDGWEIGFHSFLTYKGHVLDVTANQFISLVKLKEDVIIGEIPDNLFLFGIKEPQETLFEILRYHKIEDIESWLLKHRDEIIRLNEKEKLDSVFRTYSYNET